MSAAFVDSRTALAQGKDYSVFRVMSYNVENLFDCAHDEGKDDTDFTPEGSMHWTESKYRRKLHAIAEVISSVGQWGWPALVGLVEVENDEALQALLSYTPLGRVGYKYIMTHSPDRRGVDVALLYLPDKFKLITSYEYQVEFSDSPDKVSRNVLHVQGQLENGATLHAMVCHLPSRREGARKTSFFRRDATGLIREKCDSLAGVDRSVRVIIMGDFNGEPEEAATTLELRAGLLLPHREASDIEFPPQLYNLFGKHASLNPPGSYVYKGRWTQLDQIIISQSLILKDAPLVYKRGTARTVYIPRLVKPADNVGQMQPYRTYLGTYYQGGYSDHLPVIADFVLQ